MSNKKMLFISSFNSEIMQVNGVSKKIFHEINTFKYYGYLVDFIEINNEGVFLNSKEERIFYVKWQGTYHKTFIALYKELKLRSVEYDIVYLRYEHISFSMLSFFYDLKKRKGSLIIGELPTYMGHPYKTASLKERISFYLKRIINNISPKKIDYLVTFSDHDRLFRIKTIKIENFIDVENINKRKVVKSNKKECNLLVLAQLTPAHGVDLVIKGLANYYKSNKEINCFLHIVGNGHILKELKDLVSKLGLESYVKFYGALGGKELDNIFDICDIGMGALAINRKGSYKLSELKIREYTARGLPFVYNAYEPQLEGCSFCLKIPLIDKPIDIEEVVGFYLKLVYSNEVIDKMHEFAKDNFTAKKQLKKVVNSIEEYYEL